MRRAWLLGVLLAGCGSEAGRAMDPLVPDGGAGGRPAAPDGAPGDGPPAAAPALALFAWPAEPQDFYALPFPNDLRVRADGTLDLASHVRDDGVVGQYIDIVSEDFSGFGTQAAAYFRFAVPLDPASIGDDTVFFVDLADGARHPGTETRFSVEAGEYVGPNALTALPIPGFPLRERSVYAAVVTTGLRASDGRPVARDPRFDAVLAVPPTESYRRLKAWMDQNPQVSVAAAAAFTTRDTTSIMRQLREATHLTPVPAPDELSDPAPDDLYDVYAGRYRGPMWQEGATPFQAPADGGRIRRGADGLPVLQGTHPINFSITIPKGAPPAGGWPLVIYAHGTSGGHRSFINDGTAATLADVKDDAGATIARFAVASIDQCVHGLRNPSRTDPEINFFNLFNVYAARDNVHQCAADQFQLLRFLLSLEARNPALRFDASRLYYMGHSQGGITGPQFLAFEPEIKGAVLSGAGATFLLSLVAKTEPVDVTSIVDAVIQEGKTTEFHPLLSIVQMFIEDADPANYARLLFTAPPQGVAPKSIWQSIGFTDRYTPIANGMSLAVAMRTQPVEPIFEPIRGFDRTGLEPARPPVSGNVAGGAATGVTLEYREAPGSDGHFVVFRVPEANRSYARFLATLARDGRAVVNP